jgi:hypothetical protein
MTDCDGHLTFYLKTLYNSTDMCILCNQKETSDKPWHRYETVCGHITHTRCMRKWLFENNKTICPKCDNPLELYCSFCNVFGHTGNDNCPKVQETMDEIKELIHPTSKRPKKRKNKSKTKKISDEKDKIIKTTPKEKVLIKYKLVSDLLDPDMKIDLEKHKYVITWILLDGISIPPQSGKNHMFATCSSFEQMKDFATKILERNLIKQTYEFVFEEEPKGKTTSVSGISWI